MLSSSPTPEDSATRAAPESSVAERPVAARRWRLLAAWTAFEKHAPFVALFAWILISNVTSTLFNFLYNKSLIVDQLLDETQRRIFWTIAAPAFNALVWPVCLTWAWILVRPMVLWRSRFLARDVVPPTELQRCRRRLLNLPVYLMGLSCLGWLPGAIILPSIIGALSGGVDADVWIQFAISFVVAALFTTVQTFILVERFLTATLYPEFFQDARRSEEHTSELQSLRHLVCRL